MKGSDKVSKYFSGTRIFLAVLVGLAVSIWLLLRDFDVGTYSNLTFTMSSFFILLLALLMMVLRDLAYMYRFRVLTDGEVSWRHSFDVIMLWEFASALTPSVVGGSAAALFIVNKEIKNTGRATAIVMLTALMDEFFYIVMVPVVFIFVGVDRLFIADNFSLFNFGILPTKSIFIIGYIFILSLTTIISIAIFFKPNGFKQILTAIFRLPFLRRWKDSANKTGDEIIITSNEMKHMSFGYWFKAIAATFVSWTARFWVVNFLIILVVDNVDHMLIYARQLLMWVILLISPTPGGSGVAEYMLPKFLGEFMGGFDNEIAFTWRLISYYAYLIIGSIVLPTWINRVYKIKRKAFVK